ncbi:uncharacterized protein LOC143042749 [Mytilus galloprovincialis]|uniref:uncharacterized protein LOC143042749 n=1 Tax=Mytilus galloprovincialis TaxID=29158 RepID=UPI003F7BEA96
MVFRMLHRWAIILFTISLKYNVLPVSCGNNNCKAAIDIPLITTLNAPLKAELDISGLTTQLKELIGKEVKEAVSVAMKDFAENIVDEKAKSTLENIQTFNNLTISTFRQEMKDELTKKAKQLTELELKVERNNESHNTKHNMSANEIRSVTVVSNTLDAKIAQMKENQIKTDLKLSSIESEVTKNSAKVAISANYQGYESVSSGSVLKFDNVIFSVGINNLSTFKSTGKFVCKHNGLYMISVSIMSNTNGARFYIYLNGNSISSTYIANQEKGWWHTGTVVVSRQLKINDMLWVQTNGIFVHSTYSQLTIMKVK